MSTGANINVRVDAELKNNAEKLFAGLGLTMSSAITLFLRSAVNNNAIPFEMECETPNAVTKAALDEYEEMRKNPGSYQRYHSFDDLLNEVLGDA